MGTYHFTMPSGEEYEVDAADENAAAAALTQSGVHFGASEPAKGQAAPVEPGDSTAAFGHGLVNGVPIVGPYLAGGLDRVAAGARALSFGESYGDALHHVQDFDKTTTEAHPTADTLGNVAGATGAAAVAAPLVAAAAPGLATAGLGARTAAGLLSGAALGGGDAAVRSGGDLEKTAEGAALGGTLGGALPAVGVGLERVVRAGADGVARAAALRGVGVSSPAAETLMRSMEADGTLGGQGAANIAAAGPTAMLADAGPNARNVLDTALQRGGPGTQSARAAIEDRAAGADTNIGAALDRALGPAQGAATAKGAIREGSAPARSAAYDAAYAQPIDYTSDAGRQIETLVKNHVPASAIAQANALIRADPTLGPAGQILAHEAADGTVTFEKLPDVRQLDFITRGLKGVADQEDAKGKLGGTTPLGRTYSLLAGTLRDAGRAAVPAYGTALDTAADPIAASKAVDLGTKLLGTGVPRDVAAEQLGGMSAAETAGVRQGVRSQFDEKLANVKRTVTDPNVDARQAVSAVKDLSSDAAQQKLGMITDPDGFEAIRQALAHGTPALELRSAAAGNSRTFARGVTNEAVQQATDPGIVGRLAAGEPLKAGQALAQLVTGTRPIDRQRAQDSVYGELSRLLTAPRGQDAIDLATALARAHRTQASINGAAARVPVRAGVQAAVSPLVSLFDQSR